MRHRSVFEAGSWVEICRCRRLQQRLSQDFGNSRNPISELGCIFTKSKRGKSGKSAFGPWRLSYWVQRNSGFTIGHNGPVVCAQLFVPLGCSSECRSHGCGVSGCYRWINISVIPDHTSLSHHKGALLQVVNPFGLTLYKNAKLAQFVFHELKDKVCIVILLSFFTRWAFSPFQSVVL